MFLEANPPHSPSFVYSEQAFVPRPQFTLEGLERFVIDTLEKKTPALNLLSNLQGGLPEPCFQTLRDSSMPVLANTAPHLLGKELAEYVNTKGNCFMPLRSKIGEFTERIRRAQDLVKANYADTSRPSIKTAAKLWVNFCLEHDVSPLRPKMTTLPEDEKRMEICLRQAFLDYLIDTEPRINGNRVFKGVQGSTAEQYYSLTKGWHVEICGYAMADDPGDPDQTITRAMRGVRRLRPSAGDKEKHPHSTQHFETWRKPFQHIFELCSFKKFKSATNPGARLTREIGRVRAALAGRTAFGQPLFKVLVFCCILEVMTASLSRPAELTPAKPASKMRALRSDIQFEWIPFTDVLRSVVVKVLPLKQSVRRKGFSQKIPVPMIAEAGPYMCPAKMLYLLCLLDPVPNEQLATTRMFRFPPMPDEQPQPRLVMRYELGKFYKVLLASAKLSPKHHSLKSPRITGATTACLAKVTEMDLRALGRWSGDIAFVYVRKCKSHLENLNALISSTDIDPWISQNIAPAQGPSPEEDASSSDPEETDSEDGGDSEED